MLKEWIEATRPRTLPVSIAGVLAGTACAVARGAFRPLPALLCLLFALLAQVASNFANEYYDYKNGLDRKGREGFRRGVTEGDISPSAMKSATYGVLAADAVIGLLLVCLYGQWWMLIAGAAIAVFALAYSTGPYPLSHHGLGDIAVIVFFGIVPVVLTAYLQTGADLFDTDTVLMSVAVGLMAADVLVVNNYRDMEDDAAVGKHTTVVLFGRRVMSALYLLAGLVAVGITIPFWLGIGVWSLVAPAIYLMALRAIWMRLRIGRGAALNPLLGATAANLMVYCLLALVFSAFAC